MARYREVENKQGKFMVIYIDDLLFKDHNARLLLALLQDADLSHFDSGYRNDDGKGGRPAEPVDRMLALIFYSILYGNISMRALARDMVVRADLIYLSAGKAIDHSTFSRFRTRHREAILELFAWTVHMGVQAELIDFDTVATDGTKIKASANRRDIGTEEELIKRHEHIQKRCEKLYEEWENLKEEEVNEAEKRQKLAEKLEKARKVMEKLRAAQEKLKNEPHRKRLHMTDPDADWQKDGGDMIIGYNVQTSVDHSSGMVVHTKVGQNQSDAVYTVEMVTATEQRKRELLPEMEKKTKYLLDAGYAAEKSFRELADYDLYVPSRALNREFCGKGKPEERGSEEYLEFIYNAQSNSYTCPGNMKLTSNGRRKLSHGVYREFVTNKCGKCPLREKCVGPDRSKIRICVPESFLPNLPNRRLGVYRGPNKKRKIFDDMGPLTRQMSEKLNTPEGREIYARRFACSEGTFGIIKSCRNGWQFLRRALERVEEEWYERCIAHNIAKILGLCRVRVT